MLRRICAIATVTVIAACSSSQPTPRAQATSAQIAAAGSPDLRTVDNTGFVGPAGQTHSVSEGVGPVEIGRTEAVPPPRRENPAGGEVTAERPQPVAPGTLPSVPADMADAMERAARALCDRESFCGGVGPGHKYGSADACLSDKRERIARAAPTRACGNAIPSDRLAACLTAIRQASCDARNAPLQPPRACTSEALCG
ncbi:MAG: DUF6184 family natural product biosynthesis lipoprotein [Rhizomicrobium sp.]